MAKAAGRIAVLGGVFLSCVGCQIGYYLHSAYHQSVLINSRESIDKVLRESSVSDETKRKLRLVLDAKKFAEDEMGLASTQNYTTFVKLDSPYVTYIVQVAYAEELRPYLWKFPFVGEVPYKGYFKKSLAEEEAASFDHDRYDTYVRGVSAYSTLGWFQDSVLSSMLRYEDYELVEIILHETTHTTLYIKSAAEFNERMATFLGREGMKLYFLKKEGPQSKALAQAQDDSHDQKLFSAFLTHEVEALKKWYIDNKGHVSKENKAARLREIQTRFTKELKPNMKTADYREFEKRELNNALLLAYQTYEYSLDDFQKLFDHFHGDFRATLAYLKGLEKDSKPGQTLKEFVTRAAGA